MRLSWKQHLGEYEMVDGMDSAHNLLETVARRWMVWVSHLVTPINTMLQGRSMMDVLPMRHAMALWEMQNYHVVLGNNMSSADRVSRQ